MKKFVTILLLLPLVAFATNMTLPIVQVIDGDTIKTVLSLPCPLCNASVRIRGIDTAETTYLAKCDLEKATGKKAALYAERLLSGYHVMTVSNVQWDKYGGRIDANVSVNDIDIGSALIDAGLAKPYNGIGPKPDWCN